MSYLYFLIPVALGLLVLGMVAFRVLRGMSRLNAARGRVQRDVLDRTGLLKARGAALRVAVAQRWGDRRGNPD
ncbi:hypothetical protein JOF53_001565 [Crossiella equi]|uniref:Uncharacterized protein n=1 Tax=Crossiella equi TaxID=130796 RepID=A0ABS5A7W6_9PSEU|nr:bacteriophage holin [Crossiella equi]MBP2472693.1 hypothetical protein [Crossiella equi]